MKDWTRQFKPNKTAYRTPSSFKIRKICNNPCPKQRQKAKLKSQNK